jgi:PAS domain S-box-containing protein
VNNSSLMNMDLSPSPAVDQVFGRGGELGQLCRDKDWGKTPLGPVDEWTASLRAAASLVIGSPIGMVLLWGPQLVQIYNDGYRHVMGDKHPAGLGQPTRDCWPEAWAFNEPLYEAVTSNRESFSSDHQTLVINRNGHPEEAFFNLAFSPVIDDDGEVGGVLVTVFETTKAVERDRAEEALRRSQNRLARALGIESIGVLFFDSNGRYLDANDAFLRMTGTERSALERGELSADHVTLPEWMPRTRQAFAELRETGRLSPYEKELVRPDGSRWWGLFAGARISDDECVAFVVDVTARKQAEAALSDSEARFRALVNASSYVVFRMNPDWSEMQEVDGRGFVVDSTRPKRGWMEKYIYPEDHPQMVAAIEKAVRNKDLFELEYRVWRLDGSVGWSLSRAVPLVDDNGAITEWIGAATDITARREVEEALRRSEARYRSLFESIDEGFCVVDMIFDDSGKPVDYRFLEVNPAFERRTGLINPTGKTMRSLAPDYEAYWFDTFGQIARSGEPVRFENFTRAFGGSWFDVYAFRIDAPEANRVAILFTDITERKRAEQVQRQLAAATEFRLTLTDAVRPLADPRAIQQQAARVLGEHLGASRVLYAEVTSSGQYGVVLSDYCKDVQSVVGRHRLEDYASGLMGDLKAGKTVVVVDVVADPRLAPQQREAVIALQIGACVVVPLTKRDHLTALLVVHQDQPREWSELEIELIGETAERTWAAVEQAHTEAALRNAHRRTTNILESIADCFYALDSERRFTYVNAQAEAYLGIPKEQMLGRRYLDVLPATRGHEIHKRQEQAIVARKTSRFETLSPVTGRWVELSVFPSDDGGLTIYFRDVTNRVLARMRQKALLELGDRLRVLSEPVPIATTAAEIVGATLEAARAGYGTVDPTESSIEVIQDWTDGTVVSAAGNWEREDFWSGFAYQLRRGEPVVIENTAHDARLTAEARQRFQALNVHGLIVVPLLAEGRVMAIFYVHFKKPRDFLEGEITFVRDVTDRTWAATQRARSDLALRESDRRKDEFLAMLAHELRNPLAAIRNAVKLLEQTPPGESGRYLDMLNRQSDMLRGLVADLLDVSRITRGLVELNRQCLDLVEIAERALESVTGTMEERRHHVHVELPGEPVMVVGDPVRLEQIMVNLLTNAAKYTDPGGRITLSLGKHGEFAELRVRDTGIGMTPEVLDRIFDLFGQAERGLARSEGGLGIGLTIVKSLVELHHGRIEARSEGVGRGAEFIVSLPAAAGTDLAASAEINLPAGNPGRKRILVVEDSPDIAETMAMLLGHAGHEVEIANDGPTGLIIAEKSQPDLILLDIGLPDMDGYEVARRLRKNPRTSSAVLAALTGYGQPSDRERTSAAGFDAHFVKPVDFEELQRFVSRTPKPSYT